MIKALELPVLPVPNLVFFPDARLPIIIADPIYIRMAEEAMAQDKMVAISYANPLEGNTNLAQFSQQKVCTASKLQLIEAFPDGSIKVIAKGLQRVEFLKHVQNIPFMIVQVRTVQDIQEEKTFNTPVVEKLHSILTMWIEHHVSDSLDRDIFLNSIQNTNQVVAYICLFIIQDVEIKQLLLENTSLYERVQLINSLLKDYDPFNEDREVIKAIKQYEYFDKNEFLMAH